jgi:hypothetical protein
MHRSQSFAIFKCVLEVFCEGVQHRLRFCLDHSYVKMANISFIFNLRNTKVRWVGTTVMLFLVKISWWKMKRETVRCRETTASSLVARNSRLILTLT